MKSKLLLATVSVGFLATASVLLTPSCVKAQEYFYKKTTVETTPTTIVEPDAMIYRERSIVEPTTVIEKTIERPAPVVVEKVIEKPTIVEERPATVVVEKKKQHNGLMRVGLFPLFWMKVL